MKGFDINDEYEAKATIIEILDNSNLNQEQINKSIIELIDYYNIEITIINHYNQHE